MTRLLLAVLLSLWALGGTAAAASVARADVAEGEPLGRFLELLEDREGTLGIAEVAAAGNRFAPAAEAVPMLGISRSAWWAWLTVMALDGGTWYLVYGAPLVDRVSAYLPDGRGGWTEARAGDLVEGPTGTLPHRHAVFPVTLAPGVPMTVYVRVENRDAVTLPLKLRTLETLYRADRSEQLLFGVLFGVLMTVCLYVLSMWSVVREPSQIHLVSMMLGLAYYAAAHGGFAQVLLTPGAAWWNPFSAEASIVLTVISGIYFTRRFLGTDGTMPRLDATLRVAAVAFAALLPTAVLDLRTAAAAIPVAGMLVSVLFLATAFAALRRRAPGAGVYLLAFSALILGGLARSLSDLGLMPLGTPADNLLFVGAGLSSIAFAAGVAAQFKARQEDKERALRLSNERYELAAQGAAAGLYDWDLVRGAVSFSPRLVELLGPPPGRAPADEPFWTGLVHPADLVRVTEEFRDFLDGGSPVLAMEYRVLSPDGVLRWVETTGAAVRDAASGRVVRLAGSTGDVTESRRAEASLRASERLKSAVIEGSLDCIISSDSEGRIIEFNPAAERTFGYARAEVLGRSMSELIIPRHLRDRHEAGMRRMRGAGNSRLIGRRIEIEAMRRDGTVFPVEIALIQVAHGPDAVYSAFVRDITERREAERALRTSERELADKSRFLETVLASMDQGISVVDADLRLRLANDRLRDMYGLSREQCRPGIPIEDLLGHAIGEGGGEAAVAERMAQFADRAEGRHEDRRPDGRVVEIWRKPMEGGWISVYSDVTERRRAEEALRASEARFRGIAEAHPVPVVISSVDGTLLYTSPRAEEVFGAPAEALMTRRAASYYAEPGDRERFVAELREKGRVDQTELTMRRWDGTTFPAVVSARAIEYEGVPALVTGIQDLTDRKLAEQEISRQREALLQSEKLAALGSLLAGVAHELNNPLSVVVGQSVLMEETAADERIRVRAAKIRKAADRCARIVRSFLALARRRPPERTKVRFDETVESAMELLSYGLRTEGVVLSLDLEPDLPLLMADADQLNQVVTNLVVNARQALASLPMDRPGGRRLSVSTRRTGDWVELRVADNGVGVPPEIRSRIFEPFFTTKAAGQGTGVGLSLCHGIAESHGGTIAVEETRGGGATFVVRLPIPAEAASATSPIEIAPAPTPMRPTGRRVLVVDDEPEIALILADALEADGHRVDVAEDGRDALDRLAQDDRYDLVLSDLRMPGLDGPALHRAIARRHPRLLPRVVFLTGDTLSESVRAFLDGTGAPVLEKPFSLPDVRATISRVLEAADAAGDAHKKELHTCPAAAS